MSTPDDSEQVISLALLLARAMSDVLNGHSKVHVVKATLHACASVIISAAEPGMEETLLHEVAGYLRDYRASDQILVAVPRGTPRALDS